MSEKIDRCCITCGETKTWCAIDCESKTAGEVDCLYPEFQCWKPKPATVPSAEEFARIIHEECYIDKSQSERLELVWDVLIAAKLIESRDAAQRQAGREEREGELEAMHEAWCDDIKQRYAALVEAARKVEPAVAYRLRELRAKNDMRALKLTNDLANFRKALSDLAEARRG